MMTWSELKICSSRLLLKPFTAEDADDAFQYITPSLTRYMSWEPAVNRQAFKQVWQTWLTQIALATDCVFVIRTRLEHRFLGLVGLHQAQSSVPELGIWIREDQHGLGYGREAVSMVFDWASHHIKAQQFCYPVAVENYASRKIAESLGGIIHHYHETPKYQAVTYYIAAKTT